MSKRLNGKVVLLTAAAQGIGLACALAMAKEGAQVIATDINEIMLKKISHPNIIIKVLNVCDGEAVIKLAQEVKKIDVLFNCAGYVHNGSILECSEKDWEVSFDINVRSQFRLCKEFIPAMLEQGYGSIINMSSGASSIKGFPNRFVYGTTKAAVIGLTKAIAADYVRKGIRCNAICPGTINTPSLQERINANPDPIQAEKDFIARQPMGRLGSPEEIAPLVVYLASDESRLVSGGVFSIDGGITI